MGEAPFSTADQGSGWVPPPPPPPAPPRRLYRRGDDRVIAGVASGIATYLGIDAVWVRVAFILAALFGGVGVLVYLVAWLAMPVGFGPGIPGGPAPLRSWGSAPDVRLVLGIGLLVVAALVLSSSLGFDQSGLIWGVALIAAGVLLLVESRWPAGAMTGGPGSPTWAAAAPGAAGAAIDPLAGTGSAPTQPVGPPLASFRQRARPILPIGWVTSAVALLAIGVIALLDNVGVVSVSFGSGIGIVLLVIGAGLIAGTWLGRSTWLLVAGLVLLPFAAAASLVHQPLAGGAGDLHFAPQSVAELRPAYHLAAGRLTVDLSQLAVTASSTDVSVTDAVGQVVVVVPADTTLDVHASAGAGDLRVLGHEESGYQVALQETSTSPGGGGTLHLDISVGMGQVTVEEPGAVSAMPFGGRR
jgi:phage shock protein PspC (stress-responsive transcriptional regulator)